MQIDFSKIRDSDDLEEVFKEGENGDVEFKSALLLENKDKFTAELSVQVSAFANSGGGYVVLGFADANKKPEAVVVDHGKQKLRDWISNKVTSCVDYPLERFKVHEVPIARTTNEFVYVIEIEESPAAPHQAKNFIYYQRIDHQTKPATHFYVERLRNRSTAVELEIVEKYFAFDLGSFELPNRPSQKVNINLKVKMVVENKSKLTSDRWGVLFKIKNANHRMAWKMDNPLEYLMDETGIIKPPKDGIMPRQKTALAFELRIDLMRPVVQQEFTDNVKALSMSLTPVSHNSVGPETTLLEGVSEGVIDQILGELFHKLKQRNVLQEQ